MKITQYKKGLFSEDISEFINTLEKIKQEDVTYGDIKRVNNPS